MRICLRAIVVFCLLCLITGTRSVSADELTIWSDFQQPIPAESDGKAWMEPVHLTVDQNLHIIDLDVHLEITHTEIGDLRILLDCPRGQTITLKEPWLLWREQRPNMYSTIFDDEAVIPLREGLPPYSGRFLPEEGSLSIFDGHNARGVWTLRIRDGYLADVGTLDRWELHITHIPEPVSLYYLLLPFLYRLRRRRIQLPSVTPP
ncbi:MAG: proprotein convertase P-domain-containing protein [Sedimentisphaerales bacterium]|nr:proprotein convertase P-domain-containing protein [Sedimentisphaerales bacterium]